MASTAYEDALTEAGAEVERLTAEYRTELEGPSRELERWEEVAAQARNSGELAAASPDLTDRTVERSNALERLQRAIEWRDHLLYVGPAALRGEHRIGGSPDRVTSQKERIG